MTDYSELLARVRAGLDGVTKGPWYIDGDVWNQVVWSAAENRVCFMAHSNGLDDERDVATARFIAAARSDVPALLAALKAVMDERDAFARHMRAWEALCRTKDDRAEAAEALTKVVMAERDEAREANRWAYVEAAMDDRQTAAEAEAASLKDENAALRARVAELECSQKPSEQTRTTPDEADAYFKARGDRYPAFLDDWRKTCFDAQAVVDDLFDVMNWLRETNNFAQSDRVRTLAGRIARAVPPYPVFSGWDDPGLIRNLARTYPNQLSPKESKLLLARAEAAEAENAALRARVAGMWEEAAKMVELDKRMAASHDETWSDGWLAASENAIAALRAKAKEVGE